MCTVSFVATENAFILTSNRDEQTVRTALKPQKYNFNNNNLYFPKDPKSGGTWFAVNDNGTVLILLNGAEEKHQHNPPYDRSRGLVVLEIISSIDPIVFWSEINLLNVEPFTLILFQNNRLFQLRWSGDEKTQKNLDIAKKHIWSSSTLYSKEIHKERSTWFYEFFESKAIAKPIDLVEFHQDSYAQNRQNGLVINRNDTLKTLSITQVAIGNNQIKMLYKDLVNSKSYENNILIIR